MDSFQRQVVLFVELSILIQKKCIEHKSTFKENCFNELFVDDKKGVATIYYGSKHNAWSIKFDGYEYNDYKTAIEIDVSKVKLIQISYAVNCLRDYHDNFENIVAPKRRIFNFNK